MYMLVEKGCQHVYWTIKGSRLLVVSPKVLLFFSFFEVRERRARIFSLSEDVRITKNECTKRVYFYLKAQKFCV